MNGIIHGFDLIDQNVDKENIKEVEVENYRSAICKETRHKVEAQIITEIKEGNYVTTHRKPHIISALGAVPKSHSSDIRLIHDCSRPIDSSLNDYATIDKAKYQSIDDAVKLSSKNCYFAKIDLKSAYRSVNIHPSNYNFTGLKWKFSGDKEDTYLFDSKLPFGARKSPFIFHRLTQSVRRMMLRRGFEKIIVYLDDFLIISETFEECKLVLTTLLKLLRELGFYINWSKVVDPTRCITFLGINLNSIDMCLELSEDKCKALEEELTSFYSKVRASKRQIQSLAGKLNWACQAIHGGRIFLRRILDAQNKLNRPTHKLILDYNFKADILWWLNFMKVFNGKAMFLDYKNEYYVHTDACNEGAGIAFGMDWAYTNWELDWPEVKHMHINHKETLTVTLAAKRWAPFWRNSKITIITDSMCTMGVINKGTSKNNIIMENLREMFWLSAIYNFDIKAIHIPGAQNEIPDAISRLNEAKQWSRLSNLMLNNGVIIFPNNIRFHMSRRAIHFLILQILNWLGWKIS